MQNASQDLTDYYMECQSCAKVLADMPLLPENSSTPKKDNSLTKKSQEATTGKNEKNKREKQSENNATNDNEDKKEKRKAPKNEWDFNLLLVNKRVKRCQHCRQGFEQNLPRNLMVGKFEEYVYANRFGEGRGRRNFFYHLNEACIKPSYNNFEWKLLKIEHDVKNKLSQEHKAFMASLGIKI